MEKASLCEINYLLQLKLEEHLLIWPQGIVNILQHVFTITTHHHSFSASEITKGSTRIHFQWINKPMGSDFLVSGIRGVVPLVLVGPLQMHNISWWGKNREQRAAIQSKFWWKTFINSQMEESQLLKRCMFAKWRCRGGMDRQSTEEGQWMTLCGPVVTTMCNH